MTYLTKTKPLNLTHRITALEHHDRFYALDADDVWTHDGWLVTSAFIQNGHLMGHVRKGNENNVVEFNPDEFLFFTPTSAKAKARLAEAPLETPQADVLKLSGGMVEIKLESSLHFNARS